MKLLALTLPSAAENLALDEALLDSAESVEAHPEILRIWEPSSPMVVLGRSSPIRQEVKVDHCRETGIDILRRCSGGQSIVAGPGCLMYALLLDYRRRPEMRMLEQVHRLVMGQMQKAIGRLNIDVQMQGTSDLTYQGRKFSGNSLRCKRNWLIYHGTMICGMEIGLIDDCLGTPIREPEYRERRSHIDFLTRLPTSTELLASAIIEQWKVDQPFPSWPQALTRQLATDKYSDACWTGKV